MLKYDIKKPMWGSQSVGIAARRLKVDTTMEVTISYKDSDGQLLYPFKYRMATKRMKTYPTQRLKGGIVLHIVPIADFEAVE